MPFRPTVALARRIAVATAIEAVAAAAGYVAATDPDFVPAPPWLRL